jgi:hypothetical protein
MRSSIETCNVSRMKTHSGSCHCGAVRFEAELDLSQSVNACNCSVCQKLGIVDARCKPSELRVVAGEPKLALYEWGTRITKRYFCTTCGAHPFARGYFEDYGGDYVAVNVNCLDDVDPSTLPIGHWDGRHDNWQAGIASKPWPVFTAS